MGSHGGDDIPALTPAKQTLDSGSVRVNMLA